MPPSLSLTVIMRDEEVHVPQLLATAHLYADEIVIVDTGSTDRTKEEARKYTTSVYDFVWCDDFSAARNYGIERCTKDFVMWLDADDVIREEDARRWFGAAGRFNGLPLLNYAFIRSAAHKAIAAK